jgi:hypothetical protein
MKKGDDGYQPQRKEIKGPVLGDAGIDGGQALAEVALHTVMQDEA